MKRKSADVVILLPRPLWQLREEFVEHLRLRPPNHDLLRLADWNARKTALEMWIQLGNSGCGCVQAQRVPLDSHPTVTDTINQRGNPDDARDPEDLR